MVKMIKKIIFIYIVLNILFSCIAFLFFSFNSFINLQVAFWSSFFIIIGSSFGYFRNFNKRVKTYIPLNDERDSIDTIEDRFDLYGEINEKEDLTKEEISQIIQEEKSKIKTKDTLKNAFTSAGAAGSIYRIIGYVLLVIGFFYLRNNGYLEPITYLLGFLIVPIMALITNYQLKNQNFEQ